MTLHCQYMLGSVWMLSKSMIMLLFPLCLRQKFSLMQQRKWKQIITAA